MSRINIDDIIVQISRDHNEREHLKRRTKSFEGYLIALIEREGQRDAGALKFILECYQEQVLGG